MTWQEEMGELARNNSGLLRPIDVVLAAKNPKSELHTKFEWDDRKASHQWRLWQARQLIVQVYVTVEVHGILQPVQAFVSLVPDRQEPDGGYRDIGSVLSNEVMRQQIIAQVLQQIDYWQSRYQEIRELCPLFRIAQKIKRHIEKKNRKK